MAAPASMNERRWNWADCTVTQVARIGAVVENLVRAEVSSAEPRRGVRMDRREEFLPAAYNF